VKGAITTRLLALGWRRNDFAEGQCGAVGETTGFCYRIAKWERFDCSMTLCAAHALQASQARGERVR
jgi:hypothetical protein